MTRIEEETPFREQDQLVYVVAGDKAATTDYCGGGGGRLVMVILH